MESEFNNIWPLNGKHVTVGIVEEGLSTRHIVYFTISVALQFYNASEDTCTKQKYNSRKTTFKQGKSLSERITIRRSFSIDWENPSIHGTYAWGWSDFLSHEYLFYDERNDDGWQYIYEDSMKFSFRYIIQYEKY